MTCAIQNESFFLLFCIFYITEPLKGNYCAKHYSSPKKVEKSTIEELITLIFAAFGKQLEFLRRLSLAVSAKKVRQTL